MSDRTNRRGFLRATALTGVGCWVAGGQPAARAARKRQSPNDRIAMASIGLSGKGLSDSNDAGAAGEMVAICDADAHVLNSAGEKRFPKAKRYTDFRKMLEEVGDRIDAVTVSTPDHNRAAAALMAMRMGKHCFCQIWTGTFGSVRRRPGLSATAIIRPRGAAGGISAPARWATWPATPSTCPTWP